MEAERPTLEDQTCPGGSHVAHYHWDLATPRSAFRMSGILTLSTVNGSKGVQRRSEYKEGAPFR